MGQAASDLFSMAEGLDELNNDGDPHLDSKLLQTRQRLLVAIQTKEDCTSILDELMSLDCPNIMKYSAVNVQDLLLENNQNLEQLKAIPIGLNILEKYGRHLIKPELSRNELWRYVKFSNPIFKERVKPLKGSMEIMNQMGYTNCVEDGLYFPQNKEPDILKTTNIIADIILAKHEMEAYISGTHPKPDEIGKFLSPQAIKDVQCLQRGLPLQRKMNQSEANLRYPTAGVPLPGMSPPASVLSTSIRQSAVISTPAFQTSSTNIPTISMSPTLPNDKRRSCDICAEQESTLCCAVCDNKRLCANCDEKWHKHPKRQSHKRTPVLQEQSLDFKTNTINVQGPYGIKALPNMAVKRPVAVDNSNPSPPRYEFSSPVDPSSGVSTAVPTNLPNLDCLVLKSTELILDPCSQPVIPSVTSHGDLYNKSTLASEQKPEIPDRRLKPEIHTKPKDICYQSVYLPPQIPFLNSNVNSNIQATQPSVSDVQSATHPSGTTNITSAEQLMESNRAFQTSDLYAYPSYCQHGPNIVNSMVVKSSAEVPTSASGAAQQQLQYGLHRSNSAAAHSVQLAATDSLQRTSSAAASGCLVSKLLEKIMAVPDFEKRRAKCEINILTLAEEMEEIEDKLTNIVEENENFHESPEFSTLNRKKGMLLREKKSLQKYKEELDSMTVGSAIQTSEAQDVFYPPSVISVSSCTGVTATNPLQSVASSKDSFMVMSSEMLPRTCESADPESVYVTSVGLQSATSRPTLPSGTQNFQQYQQVRAPGSEYTDVAVQLQQAHSHHLFHQQQMPTLRAQLSTRIPASAAGHPQTTVVSQVSPPTFSPSVPSATRLSTGNTSFQESVSGIPKTFHRVSDVYTGPFELQSQQVSGIAQSTQQTSQHPVNSAPDKPAAAASMAKQPARRESSSGFEQKWHCEHCTMINDPGTRVCHMCNKTSDVPTFVAEAAGGAVTREPEENEETTVVKIGKKIGKIHDQIYYEKLEAHKKFEESLKKEATRKEIIGRKSDDVPLESPRQSSLYPLLPPKETELQQSCGYPSGVQTTQTDPQHSDNSLGCSSSGFYSSGSQHERASTFMETIEIINEKRHIKRMMLDGADLLQLFKSIAQKLPQFIQEDEIAPLVDEWKLYQHQKISEDLYLRVDATYVRIVHYWKKSCQKAGYEFEVVELALECCDREFTHVLDWLNKNWRPMINKLIERVKLEGEKLDQNDVGEISEEESVAVLKDTKGNLEEAVIKFVQARKALYAEINGDRVYAREEVLEAMFQENGKKDAILLHLDKNRLQPFVDRVWNGALLHTDLMQITMNDTCNSVATSVINHQQFQDQVKDQQIETDRRIRMVLVEARLKSWGRAENVLKILDNDLKNLDRGYECTLEDIVEAVRNCADRKSSIVYLQKECQICYSKYPMSKIRNLNFCQCQMCVECFKQNFALTIRERNVRNWSCPICEQPDLEDQDVASNYLSFLSLLLNTLVEQDLLDLYETKIRDWYLQKDPNFRWCAHCGNGFVYQGWQNDRGRLDMTCTNCKKKTCFNCKKQWVDQHAGLTCQEYEQWTIDNDPKNQAVGLAKHLEESGIDCPSCKMRYSLAKGGCMHFKCPECLYEFCSGCNQPFLKTGMCKKYTSCDKQGFHCHHPRDCYSYLRDQTTEELQDLLQQGKVDFNTATPAGQQDQEHCPVMEQKEGDCGHKDEACGRDVPVNHAGLCGKHYTEYLVGLINNNKLDPVLIMNVEAMDRLLDRMEIKTKRPKKKEETDDAFLQKYRKFVQTVVPLVRH